MVFCVLQTPPCFIGAFLEYSLDPFLDADGRFACDDVVHDAGPLWCARTLFVLNDGDGNNGGFADVYQLLVEVAKAAINSFVTCSDDSGGSSGDGGSATYLNPAACASAAADSFWSTAKSRGVALAAASAGTTFSCKIVARDMSGKPAELVAGTVLRAVKVITVKFECPSGAVVFGDSFIDAGIKYATPSGVDHHREAAVLTSIVPEVLSWSASPVTLTTDPTLRGVSGSNVVFYTAGFFLFCLEGWSSLGFPRCYPQY